MCNVAVDADVKEGKDNLTFWLICKYVCCKGQINITSWIYNVADGSWNYFWPLLWLFTKVSAACLLVKLLNDFISLVELYQSITWLLNHLFLILLFESLHFLASWRILRLGRTNWETVCLILLLSLDRILCQIPGWGSLISTLKRSLNCDSYIDFSGHWSKCYEKNIGRWDSS